MKHSQANIDKKRKALEEEEARKTEEEDSRKKAKLETLMRNEANKNSSNGLEIGKNPFVKDKSSKHNSSSIHSSSSSLFGPNHDAINSDSLIRGKHVDANMNNNDDDEKEISEKSNVTNEDMKNKFQDIAQEISDEEIEQDIEKQKLELMRIQLHAGFKEFIRNPVNKYVIQKDDNLKKIWDRAEDKLRTEHGVPAKDQSSFEINGLQLLGIDLNYYRNKQYQDKKDARAKRESNTSIFESPTLLNKNQNQNNTSLFDTWRKATDNDPNKSRIFSKEEFDLDKERINIMSFQNEQLKKQIQRVENNINNWLQDEKDHWAEVSNPVLEEMLTFAEEWIANYKTIDPKDLLKIAGMKDWELNDDNVDTAGNKYLDQLKQLTEQVATESKNASHFLITMKAACEVKEMMGGPKLTLEDMNASTLANKIEGNRKRLNLLKQQLEINMTKNRASNNNYSAPDYKGSSSKADKENANHMEQLIEGMTLVQAVQSGDTSKLCDNLASAKKESLRRQVKFDTMDYEDAVLDYTMRVENKSREEALEDAKRGGNKPAPVTLNMYREMGVMAFEPKRLNEHWTARDVKAIIKSETKARNFGALETMNGNDKAKVTRKLAERRRFNSKREVCDQFECMQIATIIADLAVVDDAKKMSTILEQISDEFEDSQIGPIVTAEFEFRQMFFDEMKTRINFARVNENINKKDKNALRTEFKRAFGKLIHDRNFVEDLKRKAVSKSRDIKLEVQETRMERMREKIEKMNNKNNNNQSDSVTINADVLPEILKTFCPDANIVTNAKDDASDATLEDAEDNKGKKEGEGNDENKKKKAKRSNSANTIVIDKNASFRFSKTNNNIGSSSSSGGFNYNTNSSNNFSSGYGHAQNKGGKGKGKGKGKRSSSAGSGSADAWKAFKPCRHFREGNCRAGNNCAFKH